MYTRCSIIEYKTFDFLSKTMENSCLPIFDLRPNLGDIVMETIEKFVNGSP